MGIEWIAVGAVMFAGALFLGLPVGVAIGYVWRDRISRARRLLVQQELRRQELMHRHPNGQPDTGDCAPFALTTERSDQELQGATAVIPQILDDASDISSGQDRPPAKRTGRKKQATRKRQIKSVPDEAATSAAWSLSVPAVPLRSRGGPH
jgi:hypothetical protein